MREIKFRVWNPRLKEMSEPFAIEALLSAEVRLLHKSSHDEPISWLQYTGLKDCKGKEIYEGDIVRYEDGDGEVLITKVVWEMVSDETTMAISGLAFEFIRDVTDEIYDEDGGAPKDWDGSPEVIGNIYENPDLVSQGTKEVKE